MKRFLWISALVVLVVLPGLAGEPGPPAATPETPPAAAATVAATPTTAVPSPVLRGPFDLYGSFWFPGLCESEWSSFLIPTGPMNVWDAYTWGFVRFRSWFDAQRYGWGWPPNGSPLGWGWDGWYGGWYGWLPDGVPAGMGMGGGWGYYAPVVHPFQVAPVRPAEAVAPRPPVRPGRGSRGWFDGAIRPARPDERPSTNPDDWSRGGLSSGGGDPGGGSKGAGVRPTPTPRPTPPAPKTRPPTRRR